MKNPFLLRNFNEVLDRACTAEHSLKKVRGKMNALLEDYAVDRGTSLGKLRLIDVCTGDGRLRPELYQHITEVYPLAEGSRPSYVSCARRLVKMTFKTSTEVAEERTLALSGLQIPEPVERMLPLLPREGTKPEVRDPEIRPTLPYTRNGIFLLLAVLSVWTEFQLTSLESLFLDHVSSLRRAIRRITRKNHDGSTISLMNRVRNGLGIPQPEKGPRPMPLEQVLEPLRTEILTYRARALSMGDEKPAEERLEEKKLIAKASRYGYRPQKLRVGTVEKDVNLMCRMYARILPLIESDGLDSFGIRDILCITHEVVDDDGEDVTHSLNKYFESYRNIEVERSSMFKRAGYDSSNFRDCYNSVRMIAAYNGYFANLKNFCEAYRTTVLDWERMERRKEIKKTIFSIEYVDGELARMRKQYERILRGRSFARTAGRPNAEADCDLTFCFFYVAFVMMRYLSYRQKCVRDCVVGSNITFNRGGSVTLFWTKDKVKNKKPIRVTLTADRFEGAWEPVIHALKTYKSIVYPYALSRARAQGSLESLGGQFILHLNGVHEVVRWSSRDALGFYAWFHARARQFLTFPDEAVEADIRFNPHFLRGLCVDWMYEIGMSMAEISVVTGDTEAVLRRKYLNRNIVLDATRILAQTDRRLRQEQAGEFDARSYLDASEAAHRAELKRRDIREEELRRRHEQQLTDLRAGILSEHDENAAARVLSLVVSDGQRR